MNIPPGGKEVSEEDHDRACSLRVEILVGSPVGFSTEHNRSWCRRHHCDQKVKVAREFPAASPENVFNTIESQTKNGGNIYESHCRKSA